MTKTMKNENTNNTGNNDSVSFLLTKTMVIRIMEELVTITIVTVIMMFRRNSMESKKNKTEKKQTSLIKKFLLLTPQTKN